MHIRGRRIQKQGKKKKDTKRKVPSRTLPQSSETNRGACIVSGSRKERKAKSKKE